MVKTPRIQYEYEYNSSFLIHIHIFLSREGGWRSGGRGPTKGGAVGGVGQCVVQAGGWVRRGERWGLVGLARGQWDLVGPTKVHLGWVGPALGQWGRVETREAGVTGLSGAAWLLVAYSR